MCDTVEIKSNKNKISNTSAANTSQQHPYYTCALLSPKLPLP